jgi:hypothetical protein
MQTIKEKEHPWLDDYLSEKGIEGSSTIIFFLIPCGGREIGYIRKLLSDIELQGSLSLAGKKVDCVELEHKPHRNRYVRKRRNSSGVLLL